MIQQNRKTRSPRSVGTIVFVLFFAASFALGSPPGRPRNRREAVRLALIRGMDVFGQYYAGADWSAVTSELQAHPAAAGNAAVMSISLALGNVYLNRYEVGRDKADLDRAIGVFEAVASNHALWGNRAGSGSIVSYLDISISRVDGECDIGGFESRTSALWETAKAITAEEAVALQAAAVSESTDPVLDVGDASRASLLAAAANFLGDDPRAEQWDQSARQLASRISATVCQTPETILALSQGGLSYRLVGREEPAEFAPILNGARGFASILNGASGTWFCPRPQFDFQTTGPVAAVSPGDSLDLAIHDSRVVAYRLSQVFLRLFPPGSQCSDTEEDDFDLTL